MRLFVGFVLALSALPAASVHGESPPSTNLLTSTGQQIIWRLDMGDGCRGQVKNDQGVAQFIVMEVNKVPAQVQAFLGDLDLRDGMVYTVSGKIRANGPRKILLTATIDEDDWHGIGLHEKLNVTPDYQPFEFTFRVADTVRRKNRLQFIMGHETGSIWVKDITLQRK